MKSDSESAAEELIHLRGHHQHLKKTHQLLTQQVAHYVQMARNQEQLLSVTQQEINDLKEKISPDASQSKNEASMPLHTLQGVYPSSSDVVASHSALEGLRHASLLPFQSEGLPLSAHFGDPMSMTPSASGIGLCLPSSL